MRSAMRTIKIDTLLYEKLMIMGAMMGVKASELLEEAVASHLAYYQEGILDRVQERLDNLFAKANPETEGHALWRNSAPEGWSLRKEIWGAE